MDSQHYKLTNFLKIFDLDEDDDSSDKKPFVKRLASAAADLKKHIKNE